MDAAAAVDAKGADADAALDEGLVVDAPVTDARAVTDAPLADADAALDGGVVVDGGAATDTSLPDSDGKWTSS